MLTAKEAYKKLLSKISDMYAESCTEYSNFYVFSMIPNNQKRVFDGLYMVDKNDGKISPFQPFMTKEKGKRVLGYK